MDGELYNLCFSERCLVRVAICYFLTHCSNPVQELLNGMKGLNARLYVFDKDMEDEDENEGEACEVST